MEYQCKKIEGYPEYEVDTEGHVYSYKKGYKKEISPWVDSCGRYLMIRIISSSGEHKKMLLHRLVAQTFIPNPNNLPEVNHKDKNTQNPKADNLEWCTRKANLEDSYKTMSPVRNKNICFLYKNKELIGKFDSVSEASRYASLNFKASQSSLEKYLQYDDLEIIASRKQRKSQSDGQIHRIQNKKPITLEGDGISLIADTAPEMVALLQEKTGEVIKAKTINAAYKNNCLLLHKYKVRRK